ncbi:hypothetical protein SAMN04487950_0916 [Halogranum rubrum]|uniref:Uncharacterized protein n=1 Tax=Halogranum rubrum TaxID=553466 RepID=A0A1I4C3I3_9EURY|nr:twin-arginine translocation signal domain-containing protein [Halogranum rubrum]SFK75170.1 hypothetical protein SAMN04487950_0916 [Halogranum rubrum]
MPSRRQFLTTSAAGLSGLLAGCAGFGSLTSGPEHYSDLTLPAEQQFIASGPTVGDGPSDTHDGPAFAAQVFSDPDSVEEQIEWNAISMPIAQSAVEEYATIDYDEQFLAVFVTTQAVTEPNENIGWCPDTSVDGDEFTFAFRLEEYPEEIRGDRLLVFLERWDLNGHDAPTDAVTDLRIEPDPGKSVLTCDD